jgi:hypothetical protein
LLISYQSQLLQEICFQSASVVRHLGEKEAICLQARHADIQAAQNVFDLLVGRVSIEGNVCTWQVPELLSIALTPNYGVATDGGQYDWATVARVKVMGINDVR